MTDVPICATCDLVKVYVDNTENYISAVAQVMVDPMTVIFAALVGVWLSIEGIKLIMGSTDLIKLCRGVFFVIIAGGLLATSDSITLSVYNIAVRTVGGAAGDIMTVASLANADISSDMAYAAQAKYEGVERLAFVAENGFLQIMDMAWELWKSFSVGNLTGPLTGVLIIIPWFMLITVYFSQIVVTLFRVAVIVALGPFVLLGVGFDWSRSMVWKALKSLIAAGMVLYGATFAIGLTLFAVGQIDFSEGFGAGSFFTGKAFIAVLLGIMGTILVAEATAIANSIAESQFTNVAAGAMAGSVLAAAMTISKKYAPPGLKQALNVADKMTGAGQDAVSAGQSAFNERFPDVMGDMGKYMDALRKGGIDRG